MAPCDKTFRVMLQHRCYDGTGELTSAWALTASQKRESRGTPVDKTNSRYPGERIRMQGAGSEDMVSLESPHIKTDMYRGLLILVRTYATGIFAYILFHILKRRISSAFQIQIL